MGDTFKAAADHTVTEEKSEQPHPEEEKVEIREEAQPAEKVDEEEQEE